MEMNSSDVLHCLKSFINDANIIKAFEGSFVCFKYYASQSMDLLTTQIISLTSSDCFML